MFWKGGRKEEIWDVEVHKNTKVYMKKEINKRKVEEPEITLKEDLGKLYIREKERKKMVFN